MLWSKRNHSNQATCQKQATANMGVLRWSPISPPEKIIGMQLLVSTIFLEIVLGERPDNFVEVLPSFKLKWPQTHVSQGAGIRVIIQKRPQMQFRESSVCSYWSRQSSLRSFLERGQTTLLRSYPASSSSGHKIKGLEFMSSFRSDLRCSSRFKIFSTMLIIALDLTGLSSVRSPLKGFDLRMVSSHSIKQLSSLTSIPFKG